jgi:hypothetical protein
MHIESNQDLSITTHNQMQNTPARKATVKKMLKKSKGLFNKVDISQAGHAWADLCYMNNHYTVTIQSNAPMSHGVSAIKALVQRHDNKPLTRHWRELQAIKNELWGESAIAVEYYPDENDLVNDANVYWLWIVDRTNFPIPLKG